MTLNVLGIGQDGWSADDLWVGINFGTLNLIITFTKEKSHWLINSYHLWPPYILHQNLRNPQTLEEFPETAAKKSFGEIIKTEVRKLKDIKGQKSPKLSDRGHPKPTIKKLIEENRGNYQILHLVHRPQKIIGWPEQNWKNRNSRFFEKKNQIGFCSEPERKN